MFHAALLKNVFLENYLIHYRENTKIKSPSKLPFVRLSVMLSAVIFSSKQPFKKQNNENKSEII